MSEVSTGNLSRRSLAKGAAWTIPVVAAGVAAPAATASTTRSQDVVIEAGCHGLNIFGVGASFPEFTITAVQAPVLAGSTFILSGGGIADVKIGTKDQDLVDVQILGKDSARITLKEDIPAGGQHKVRIDGVIAVQALTRYALTAENIIGNANADKSNDSASEHLTGVKVGLVFVGICGSSRGPEDVVAENQKAMRKLSTAQQAQVAAHLGN